MKVSGMSSLIHMLCRTSWKASSVLGPAALKTSARILSFPDALLEFIAEMAFLASQ